MHINYDELTRTSVHKIREIARNIGVKSPTLLTKQKLIEQIMKIKNKEIEPFFNKSRVGRPPKSLTLNTTNASNTPYNLDVNINGAFTLNYTPSYFVSNEENEKTKEFKGCLFISEKFGMLITDSNIRVVVSISMVNHNKLRTGDMLKVKANPDPSNKQVYVTTRIIESYDFKLGEERQLFENLKITKDTTSITNNVPLFNELNLHTGYKYFIKTTSAKKQHAVATEILNGITDTSFKKFYLNFDGNRNDSKLQGETKILFNEKENEKILKVNVFFEHIKRNVEQGKKCMVLFSNLWKYMRDLNLFYKKQTSDKVLLETITKIRDIVAFARNTQNGGSVTMFIIDCLTMPEMYLEVMKYDVLDNVDGKVTI